MATRVSVPGGRSRRPATPRPAVAVFETEAPSSLIFLQALGSRGVPIHVYGPGRFPPGRLSPHCVMAARCPDPRRFDEFQTWLSERLQRRELARVAPTSDLIAYHCAALRDAFPPEVRDTIPGLDEIEDILIKSRFNARCEALGIPVPRTWYPESPAEAAALASELPYPVMIKPRSHLGVGMNYRGAVVHDAASFLAAFGPRPAAPGQEPLLDRYPELRWPMVQEFLPGARGVHSLCGMRDHRAGIVADAAVCKTDQWPPGVGIATRFVTTDDPDTITAGRRVIDALLVHGLFCIELLVDGDRRLPIDLNPRAYLALSLDIARGHDLPDLWYRSTLGEPLTVQPPPVHSVEWRRQPLFHLSHWARVLGGPGRRRKLRRYRALLGAPAVGGTEGSPLSVRLACELRLLRHPRSLVRPYWREPE